MKKVFGLVILLLFGCIPSQIEEVTIIHDIQVIDVIKNRTLRNQTVVIKDNLITFVGTDYQKPQSIRAKMVDGTNKYLMPGLWDMHFHLCWEAGQDSLLFKPLLGLGITGIRDMGGDLQIQNEFKTKIATDPFTGPAIYGPGPILDGNPPVMTDFTLPLDESTDVEHLLDSLVMQKADFLKVYSLLRKPTLDKIATFARKNNIEFCGHLSEFIDPEVSIQAGQKSVEHLNRLDNIYVNDSTRIQQIAKLMVAKNSWLSPTLIIYYNKAFMNDPSIVNEASQQLIHPMLHEEWTKSRQRRMKTTDWNKQRQLFKSQQDLVLQMHQLGVNILSGSDFGGMPYVYPGIGLHRELQLLSQAGLSNFEVLRTATINPAIYFNIQDKYGSIEIGKYADFIILESNPMEDIKNTLSIFQVYKNGKVVIEN